MRSHVQDLVDRLASLGVPDRVLSHVGEGDAYPAIVRAFAAQPQADPPSAYPGEIIGVVGDLAAALSVAGNLCHHLRLDPSRVVVASESAAVDAHISDPAEAATRAQNLRRDPAARIVVLDAPATRHDSRWAAEVLKALDPDTVLAVVEPARRTVDNVQHVQRLGRVDVLAVHGSTATAEPASPLALDIPVVLLDGHPATPHAWAALLCERLYERAGDDVR
jgi:hypothetical protein